MSKRIVVAMKVVPRIGFNFGRELSANVSKKNLINKTKKILRIHFCRIKKTKNNLRFGPANGAIELLLLLLQANDIITYISLSHHTHIRWLRSWPGKSKIILATPFVILLRRHGPHTPKELELSISTKTMPILKYMWTHNIFIEICYF